MHIRYNSTAFFDKESIIVPTSETLFMVFEKSLEDPQPYIDELDSQLRDVNPFSSTINAIFTDPRDPPETRSSTTRTKSIFGIAGAAAALALTIVAGILLYRKRNTTDDNTYDQSFNKQINGDATVAGETVDSESNNSIYDSSLSMSPSTGSIENNDLSKTSIINSQRRKFEQAKTLQTANGISTHLRRPRTVAEIESLLSIGDGDII